eukprot:9864544-Ditylum_brightwellii.AAC.1
MTLKEVSSPANKKLITVDEQLPQLDNYKIQEFHTTMAKLLYVMKKARPAMETTVSFLMKRVSNSNAGDWETLLRALG